MLNVGNQVAYTIGHKSPKGHGKYIVHFRYFMVMIPKAVRGR